MPRPKKRDDDFLDYRVIEKREIPPPPQRENRLYGQWQALARLIAMLPATQAIELSVDSFLYPSKVISSIHGGAREVGIKVSTMFANGKVYIARAGESTREPRFFRRVRKVRCLICSEEFETHRLRAKVCGDKCREELQREHRRRYEERKRRKRQQVMREKSDAYTETTPRAEDIHGDAGANHRSHLADGERARAA